MLACSVVGSPSTVRDGLAGFIERTGADEVMVAAAVHDHRARLKSFEIVAELAPTLPRVERAATTT
jgi:alkanesulfonate monooxygenase SsuD/methylene tetrahydromethanopterin reductase-like flavin-dependent oxidoreductase (luciferase family)